MGMGKANIRMLDIRANGPQKDACSLPLQTTVPSLNSSGLMVSAAVAPLSSSMAVTTYCLPGGRRRRKKLTP